MFTVTLFGINEQSAYAEDVITVKSTSLDNSSILELKNNRGKVIKSSLEDDLVIEKKGQKIEKLQYEGCPKFNPSQKVGGLNHQDQHDPFDW